VVGISDIDPRDLQVLVEVVSQVMFEFCSELPDDLFIDDSFEEFLLIEQMKR